MAQYSPATVLDPEQMTERRAAYFQLVCEHGPFMFKPGERMKMRVPGSRISADAGSRSAGRSRGLRLVMAGLAAWVFTTASIAGTPSVDEWITDFTGSPLYPSQLGAPGWPGVVEGQAAPSAWGFPERIPYPGSVEHVRVQLQRYTPVVPVYNAKTLIKSFRSTELPGIARERIRDYAEPIYSVPKYADPKPTGKYNKPVRVVAWDKNSAPIELSLGTFEPGTYVICIVAATPTENVERMTKRLVINCEINDGPAGEINRYRKRCAAIDEFYSIVEFFFHAPESRAYRVKLSIDPSTVLPVVLLHNIDVHNKLAQVAGKAGKKTATFYDPVQRLAGWKEKGTYRPDARALEVKLADDLKLWQEALPLNAQPTGGGDGHGGWSAFTGGADYLVPPGVVDDGMGIDFYGKDTLWNRSPEELAALTDPKRNRGAWRVNGSLGLVKRRPSLAKELTRHTAYLKAGWSGRRGQQTMGKAYAKAFAAIKLAKQYHETGDEVKARQAAICLARLGLQNASHGSRQTMRTYDMIPGVIHGDAAFRRRYKQMVYDSRGAFSTGGFVASYDYLFPYIQNNVELATALGRFIPWIKTPADAQRFYETYILQHYAHQVMTYNAFVNNGTAGWMANVMAVQQDPSIVKPWSEWLFRYVWVYPNRPMGVDEVAVNAITRDGTNKKGSTFYTWGGSALSTVLARLELCRNAGLELPAGMRDPDQFPKAYWGKRFKEDITVAGGYAFYIGDVSGPNRERLKDLGRELRKTPEKIPNNPSRVLSTWAGILETGHEQADFRQRRAAGVRVGSGYGHAHHDPFDLQIWAHGVPMCGDGGARNGYAEPGTGWLGNHNTVVSDLANGHQWVSSFAPLAGAQYLKASLLCAGLYERQVALVDVDATNSYVVDVFRIKGGNAPAYAFHGPPADQFEVNATGKHPAEVGRFLPEASKWRGLCPETLTATWRMRRDPETVTWTTKAGVAGTLAVPGAERMAMGADFDEKAPRKFIRLYLLGHAGDEAYGGRALCMKATPYTMENLYVRPRDWKGETVFVAVFEPFAGEGSVKAVRLITPAASLTNAAAPVAVEVTLRDGRRDVICLAQRDRPAAAFEGMTVQGEFGLASFDEKGVRQAALVGGTRLEVKGMTLTTKRAAYEGTIQSIEYFKRTATLSQPLPPEAAGAVIEVGKPPYPTSYALTKAGGADVTFLKGMDFAMSRVVEFSTNGLPVLQSQIAVIPGMTVTDDGYKTFWRFAADANAGRFALVGGPATKDALKLGDAVRVWEIGPGDSYRLPVQVKVVRQADGKYQATGNAPVTVAGKP